MSSLSRFLHARLSPEGYLGLHLTVGALLLVAASAVFGAIAEDVVSADALTLLDVRLAQWLHHHASAGVTRFMLAVSYLHGVAGIFLWSCALGCYFLRHRLWYWLLSLTVAVGGGALLNTAMKLAFHRARPTFDDPLVTLLTYSFPSGHTAGTTAFYGVLACYLYSRTKQRSARALIALAAFLLVVLVGASRMYLGAHYFSDVLGAAAEGAAWLTLTITAVSTLRRRRLFRKAQIAGAVHA